MRYLVILCLLVSGCKIFKKDHCYMHENQSGLYTNHARIYKIIGVLSTLDYQVMRWTQRGWRKAETPSLNAEYIEIECPLGPWERVVEIIVPEERDLCYFGFPEKCY